MGRRAGSRMALPPERRRKASRKTRQARRLGSKTVHSESFRDRRRTPAFPAPARRQGLPRRDIINGRRVFRRDLSHFTARTSLTSGMKWRSMFSTPDFSVAAAPGIRSRPAHMQVDDAVLERREHDVAAVLRHDRADAGVEKLLDLPDGFIVVTGSGGDDFVAHDFLPRGKMLHDRPEDRRRKLLQEAEPVFVTVMKSTPRKTPATPFILKRTFRSGEAFASPAFLNSAVPCRHDLAAGQEFKAGGVGGLFRLDKHVMGYLSLLSIQNGVLFPEKQAGKWHGPPWPPRKIR